MVAHEFGHHIEHQLGLLAQAQRPQGPESGAVRVELMADCLAGIRAHHALSAVDPESGETFLTPLTDRDIADALSATAAVGDDRIQEQVQGQITRRPSPTAAASSVRPGSRAGTSTARSVPATPSAPTISTASAPAVQTSIVRVARWSRRRRRGISRLPVPDGVGWERAARDPGWAPIGWCVAGKVTDIFAESRADRLAADRATGGRSGSSHTTLEDLHAVIAHKVRAPLTVVDQDRATLTRDHGLAGADTERIFDKYTQTDQGATGVGLGLHVSRGLYRANGGDLTVAIPPGGGRLFTLHLTTSATPATAATG